MKYVYGQQLEVKAEAPLLEGAPFCAANLVNEYGFDVVGGKDTIHSDNSVVDQMWLLNEPKKDIDIVFTFEDTVPVGRMRVWNYNATAKTDCGIKEVSLYSSVDGISWRCEAEKVTFAQAPGAPTGPTDLLGGEIFDFGGVTAKYIRMHIAAKPGNGNYGAKDFGLAKVQFFVGEGYAVARDEEWTALLAEQYNGWTGSDGVFTIPMNAREIYTEGADTMITFGDTLLNTVNPESGRRADDLLMIHNSCLKLPASIPAPDNAAFIWQTLPDGGRDSLLNPTLDVQNDQNTLGYYWPQDSVLVGDTCYTFPFTVLDWPEGPEGFKFKVDGVAMVTSPKEDGWVDFLKATHHKTNLYYEDAEKSIMYGGCLFANTEASGLAGDGYIYMYGTIHTGPKVELAVARTRENEIQNGFSWKFFDGENWVNDIKASKPLCTGVSCEMSLSKVSGKLHRGEYILIYQEDVNARFICYRTSPSPWGPFSEAKRIFCTDEVFEGRGIYTYNAKAHPHLKPAGELLISYNVNTVCWDMHMLHGEICRPKFITMYEVIK